MASRPSAAPRAVARRVAVLTTFQLQLRIELRDVKPTVWRRVLVPESVTLAKLHTILQAAMGWTDSHLHEYVIARRHYGIPDDEWPTSEPLLDERRARLKPLIEAGTRHFNYVYDFGDHWNHVVKVEDLVMPKPAPPGVLCTAGENACPPEDVGGYPGYADFLAALGDPNHEEHQNMKTWIGRPFDPTAFDIAATNQRLAMIKL
ncbi:MAG: plasmid pRiA4b ORF-3 family protein [Steroidobacteraceae bacterium]